MLTKNCTAYELNISGMVQGVGFRPFVYKLAYEWGLTGYVKNTTEGVCIYLQTDPITIDTFIEQIRFHFGEHIFIRELAVTKVKNLNLNDFSIHHDLKLAPAKVSITPDLATCEDCLQELFDSQNRRSNYGYNSCTLCGPRYSILNSLPFDRENTMMADFGLCPSCQQEYENSRDRRFFAQTISCSECGIRHQLFDQHDQEINLTQSEIIGFAAKRISEGKILCIKAIGGFHLVADATNHKAIKELRERKNRPSRPFAVMFRNSSQVREYTEASLAELEELQSEKAPIVIVKQKSGTNLANAVGPGINSVGAFLAYNPFYHLLLDQLAHPVVATSANLSGEPIIYKNDKAQEDLRGIYDYLVTNNRPISIPQDDSVIRLSPRHNKKIILRRSRGFRLDETSLKLKKPVLCMGSDLKSTFTLQTGHQTFISQYLGDLESFQSQENFNLVLTQFRKLFIRDGQIKSVLTDAHPLFYSSSLGKRIADDEHLSIIPIQHHIAHFAAVFGEHSSSSSQRSLGVVWDGTGYGDDGQIWGGEFFLSDGSSLKRVAHLEYFRVISGNRMSKETRLSALSLTESNELKPKFTEREWNNYRKLKAASQTCTSSMGRVFDAIASIIGLTDHQTFEGEAAMLLEQKAQSYFDVNGYAPLPYYTFEKDEKIDVYSMVESIFKDLNLDINPEEIAARFHETLVKIIEKMAQKYHSDDIYFSGGVFQNALLVDLIIERLSGSYSLYFHEKLSPNDENISFGQLSYFKNFNPCV
ncbi:hypothetical protein TK44_03915 [Jiulongibacter sediminis]|nr:hypothetical protein TK44_03915 [Jiulongibacter sediminis]